MHPPPMVFEDEISKEEVLEQEDKIKELLDADFGTTELHKYLQRSGKRLGEGAKQKVRRMREPEHTQQCICCRLRAPCCLSRIGLKTRMYVRQASVCGRWKRDVWVC